MIKLVSAAGTGYFYLTKTSQNYANTIESLANFDKQKVVDLERWYTNKIDLKNAKGINILALKTFNYLQLIFFYS